VRPRYFLRRTFVVRRAVRLVAALVRLFDLVLVIERSPSRRKNAARIRYV
jgi:hypothetical protein